MDAEALDPLRHQVVEIPKIAVDVTEYVLGRRRCRICETVSAARLPKSIPRGICGPQLMALIALLTGAYHLSRRNTVALLDDVLGVKLSLGTISNVESRVSDALAPAHAEARSVPSHNPVATPLQAKTSAEYIAAMSADFYPFRALLLTISGWVHREQQRTIE